MPAFPNRVRGLRRLPYLGGGDRLKARLRRSQGGLGRDPIIAHPAPLMLSLQPKLPFGAEKHKGQRGGQRPMEQAGGQIPDSDALPYVLNHVLFLLKRKNSPSDGLLRMGLAAARALRTILSCR